MTPFCAFFYLSVNVGVCISLLSLISTISGRFWWNLDQCVLKKSTWWFSQILKVLIWWRHNFLVCFVLFFFRYFILFFYYFFSVFQCGILISSTFALWAIATSLDNLHIDIFAIKHWTYVIQKNFVGRLWRH